MSSIVFGPVPSRRLGFSLGVDIIPGKYCSFDCIYCQVGRTTEKAVERKSFLDPDTVVREVVEAARTLDRIDFITFSGSGEPTLNLNIGWMLREVKKRTNVPLAVITNGSLLFLPEVRRDLCGADLVLPSLDSVTEESFRRVNRPHPSLGVQQMVEGLKAFRKEYPGKIWLEIMLINNINDTMEDINILCKTMQHIDVDKIQLNTVTRPPAETSAEAVGSLELARISARLGGRCQVICKFDKIGGRMGAKDWESEVLTILSRRSLSLGDIVSLTGVSSRRVRKHLAELEGKGEIHSVHFGGRLYFVSRGFGHNSVDKSSS